MSCGNHHETDCSEVLAEVWLFLDQECDGERRALLSKHLDECGPCVMLLEVTWPRPRCPVPRSTC